jgi:hypothetical protein
MQAELFRHLRSAHCVWQVLLIGKDEQGGVAQLILDEHLIQLRLGVLYTVAVVAIHDKYNAVGVLVVVAPQRAELVLTTDIPHGELQVLVLQRLNVEADGWDGRHDLAELQLVEDGRLTSGIEADHEDAHLLLSEQRGKPASHDGVSDGSERGIEYNGDDSNNHEARKPCNSEMTDGEALCRSSLFAFRVG